jgi:hypothetical protein
MMMEQQLIEEKTKDLMKYLKVVTGSNKMRRMIFLSIYNLKGFNVGIRKKKQCC